MSNNIYKAARNIAGITQERAAELLFISTDTLSNYERGIHEPDKDMVGEMILIYNTPHLAMQYLYDSPLSEYVPKVQIKELPIALLNYVAKHKKIGRKIDEMIAVTADGKVDEYEEEFWEEMLKDNDELQKAGLELKYADRRKLWKK